MDADDIYKLVENAANFLRGMTMDPAIPDHAKTALWPRIQELEEALEILGEDL